MGQPHRFVSWGEDRHYPLVTGWLLHSLMDKTGLAILFVFTGVGQFFVTRPIA